MIPICKLRSYFCSPIEDGGNADLQMPSPSVGWAIHKQSNPDLFHTPVKEADAFFADQREIVNPNEFRGRRGGNRDQGQDHRGRRGEFGRGKRGNRDPRNKRGRGGGDWNNQGGPVGPPDRRGFGRGGHFNNMEQGFQGPFPGPFEGKLVWNQSSQPESNTEMSLEI